MAELVTNGTMEADDNWTAVAGSTNSQDAGPSGAAHGGDFCWKFEVDANFEGIQSDAFTVVSGAIYRYVLWVYPDDTTTVQLGFRKGDNSGWDLGEEVTGLTKDAWNKVSKNVLSTTAGAGAYVQMLAPLFQNSGIWYIDDVSVERSEQQLDRGVGKVGLELTVN